MSRAEKAAAWLAALIAVSVVAGCGPSPVTRKQLDACDYGRTTCAENAREETPYSLNYIDIKADGDFEDRGQLDQAERYVLDSKNRYRNTLVVVFVHGWFHSDDPKDRDVNRARQVLFWFAMHHPDWHVEGVYVGWQAWTDWPPPFQYLTFWDRKDKADALGDHALTEIVERMDRAIPDSEHTKLLFVGHSFGGRALYRATQQTFVNRLASARAAWDQIDPNPSAADALRANNWQHPVRGVGSLVVLLEPAMTAEDFVPLYNASNDAFLHAMKGTTTTRVGIYAKNDRPLLLSITGDADEAVKVALPLSRSFSKPTPGDTTLRPWRTDREPRTIRTEDLQNQPFGRLNGPMTTHRIEANGSVDQKCGDTHTVDYGSVEAITPGSPPPYQLPKGWLQCAVREKVLSDPDNKNGAGFDKLVLPDNCMQVRHTAMTASFNPYWNASAHLDVIQGHSEFMNQSVIQLMNQMLFSERYENTISADKCRWVRATPASSPRQAVAEPAAQP